jgi:hypothetical protein
MHSGTVSADSIISKNGLQISVLGQLLGSSVLQKVWQ